MNAECFQATTKAFLNWSLAIFTNTIDHDEPGQIVEMKQWTRARFVLDIEVANYQLLYEELPHTD